MFTRLWALLTGGTAVFLKCHDGDVKMSIARMDAFGRFTCPVYPFNGIGRVILLPDGKIHPDSYSSYVVEWAKA